MIDEGGRPGPELAGVGADLAVALAAAAVQIGGPRLGAVGVAARASWWTSRWPPSG